jgi:hypothetical protein
MRGGISSNRFRGRDTRSHHKVAGPLGPPAVAWPQSSTFYLLERGRCRQYLVYRRGGTETRQRHSGHWVPSTHEMKLNTLNGGPCGLRRTIGTVTVICGNNPEGFTFHAPSRQSGNLQQHEAANNCSKRFLSFIYTNLGTVCQLRVLRPSTCHWGNDWTKDEE